MKHTVAFDAAYGGERMRAYLFLPKNGSPPYQTVVFFPAADAFRLRSSRDMSLRLGGLHHPERASVPLPGVQGDVRAVDARRDGTERRTRAPNCVVERSRTRHRLSRNAIGHRSDSSCVLRRERRRRCRRDPDRARTALEDQRASGDRDLADAAAPEIDTAQLCAARAHTDADVERPLRLRDAVRDVATSPVRPARDLRPSTNGTRCSRPVTRCRSTTWPARFSPGSTAILDRSSRRS